jgi:hypothetical protein
MCKENVPRKDLWWFLAFLLTRLRLPLLFFPLRCSRYKFTKHESGVNKNNTEINNLQGPTRQIRWAWDSSFILFIGHQPLDVLKFRIFNFEFLNKFKMLSCLKEIPSDVLIIEKDFFGKLPSYWLRFFWLKNALKFCTSRLPSPFGRHQTLLLA